MAITDPVDQMLILLGMVGVGTILALFLWWMFGGKLLEVYEKWLERRETK